MVTEGEEIEETLGEAGLNVFGRGELERPFCPCKEVNFWRLSVATGMLAMVALTLFSLGCWVELVI